MWKIFSKKEENLETALISIEKWKAELFSQLSLEVKEYFAKKVVVYFDNHMIFQQKRGLHINLMEALSTAEKEMQEVQGVFNRIEMYWVREENEHTLIIFGLEDSKEHILEKEGFNLIQRDAIPMHEQMEQLEYNSWNTLIFDVELVNFAAGWINYTPNVEERSILQAQHILLNAELKKEGMSLLEKITLEENIQSHPSYNALYEKVLRIMPKIEHSLEQEWKAGIILEQNSENKTVENNTEPKKEELVKIKKKKV